MRQNFKKGTLICDLGPVVNFTRSFLFKIQYFETRNNLILLQKRRDQYLFEDHHLLRLKSPVFTPNWSEDLLFADRSPFNQRGTSPSMPLAKKQGELSPFSCSVPNGCFNALLRFVRVIHNRANILGFGAGK